MIFVTGYFGAPIMEEAQRIAAGKGRPVLDLDRLIEEKDGRSIRRMCMMSGEHAYRNAEYEEVKALCESGQEDAVVVCGDGILYDDDSREMILRHELVIAGEEMNEAQLWERAKKERNTYHAFMSFGSEEEKRAAFKAHCCRQKELFRQIKRGEEGAGI